MQNTSRAISTMQQGHLITYVRLLRYSLVKTSFFQCSQKTTNYHLLFQLHALAFGKCLTGVSVPPFRTHNVELPLLGWFSDRNYHFWIGFQKHDRVYWKRQHPTTCPMHKKMPTSWKTYLFRIDK